MATLKISDLSVGDWVYVKWRDDDRWQGQIRETSCTGRLEARLLDDTPFNVRCTIEFVEPIPIAPEILEANGLYRHEIDKDNPQRVVLSNHFMLARTYTDVDWWRVLVFDEEIPSEALFNGIVYSVHQLQHALRLAGVEKEIVMPKK